ncbi:hypothetical protein [Sinomicrobium weinanense]|uniref:YD repeat-containing protein n=1 Tax=Sinomicrobium weinanense TaxID=2842200 RepID=A0A926Q3J8_9FLAO|nr:hypothetical protein [Sinomicrobium weinanense]MBC9795850.1 hypothetical protein [Sinomicrobium weinanense]MBU3125370.1 hypothetical protein [Sinomicrobium weinanense]
MIKTKFSHKVIAVFLTVSFLQSLLPYNMLQASNNGPTAPEATGFEPVDATDMVNLVTADFSYVLPLLNIPSPEGGYPLALAYHAGIAMDQEASWVGLGWSLNPGAINRSVNGYPDGYNHARIWEYFYDEGGTEEMYFLSLGYSTGLFSVGQSFSWGSNRSLGGAVSVGYGINLEGVGNLGGRLSAGSNGVGVGVGITTNSGLSLGVNAHSSGNHGASIGFNNNGEGFGIGLSSSGTISISGTINNNSMGISFSSDGIGGFHMSSENSTNDVVQGAGIGTQMAFNTTVNMGNYVTRMSKKITPLVVATKIGVFSLTFGKQRMKYSLSHIGGISVTGPLNYYREPYDPASQRDFKVGKIFMDFYEIPLEGNGIASENIPEFNNPVFPAYDNYNVQAQGLSGGMSSRLFENGALYGASKRDDDSGYKLVYPSLMDADNSVIRYVPEHVKFKAAPYFSMDNEISTYLGIKKANFNTSATNANIYDHYTDGVDNTLKPRRANGNYIEHFTNDQIINETAIVRSKGFLSPIATGFNRENAPSDGIGGFKITAPDGKTYHYSLPVYNHEIVTRTFGAIQERTEEAKSYFERRQLDPYATHWLLTAVTGPDYVDKNANGKVDKEDYGYWVNFEYGKWSDAFVWKAPYDEDYFIDESNSDIKTQIRGRKEVYYLDKVITRTHKALFIKEERDDGQSIAWSYKSVEHGERVQSSSDYKERFRIPMQKPLRLKKIVLVKETDDVAKNSGGVGDTGSVEIYYNGVVGSKREAAGYNMRNNVLDDSDNWSQTLDRSIKSIDFAYAYDLVRGTPNTMEDLGRSTLVGAHFKGKGGASMIPPYKFNYNEEFDYHKEYKDDFGYNRQNNSAWSLNGITTPQGAEILINYETHSLKPVFNSSVSFVKGTGDYTISRVDNVTYRINSSRNLGIQVGESLSFEYDRRCVWEEPGNCGGPCGGGVENCDFEATAKVITHEGGNKFLIKIPDFECSHLDQLYCISSSEKFSASYKIHNALTNIGGIRTSGITVKDGMGNSYTTQYKYGKNENGVGYVSYLPFAPELQQELPYSEELPAPKVMYEYTTVESETGEKIRYKFNVMKEKSPDAIKYGDIYEISQTKQNLVRNDGTTVDISSYTVKDNIAAIGQLLEVGTYNREGQLLSKIVNDYYPPGSTPNKLGQIQESYQSYKWIIYSDDSKNDKWLVNSSSRIKYPSLLRSSSEYKEGHVFKTDFRNLDAITGRASEVEMVSSTGDRIRSKTVFAYKKYPKMGSKVANVAYKNMLVQPAANYNQIMNNNGNWRTTGVGITTWKAWNNNVWRKHRAYTWKGELNADGTLKNFTDNFDWSATTDSQPTGWQMLSEVTRYDLYSNPLEIKDVNGNLASTKWGNNKVFSTSNAAYNTMFYSGAEDVSGNTFSGGVTKDASASVISSRAHTGSKSIQVAANVRAFKATPGTTGPYRLSVWAHKSNYKNTRVISNGKNFSYNQEETVAAGNWVQLNFIVDVISGKEVSLTTTSGTAYYDDFRLHPVSSSMNSYIYNEYDELTYILGPNNMGTRYEYDAGGRLIKTYAEVAGTTNNPGGFELVKEMGYRYMRDVNESPYDPLILSQSQYDTNPYRVVAYTTGGSGEFEYRWAISCNEYSDNYGEWTHVNQEGLLSMCPNNRVYVRCQVKDLTTGETKTTSRSYILEDTKPSSN